MAKNSAAKGYFTALKRTPVEPTRGVAQVRLASSHQDLFPTRLLGFVLLLTLCHFHLSCNRTWPVAETHGLNEVRRNVLVAPPTGVQTLSGAF
jgi:hypothetical protein